MTPVVASVVGWLLRGFVAAIAAVAIYVMGAATLRKFKIAPDSEPDPEQVVPVNVRFRCIVCGAEVVMTAAQAGDEVAPPRHCREDMIRV